jgi:hypothetical protein
MNQLRERWRAGILSVVLLLVATFPRTALAQQAEPPAPVAQSNQEQPAKQVGLPRGKKLFLKDGSFQVVSSYRVEGDRVRYYSVERSQWEEIPASMVDWDATHKAETEEARRTEQQLEKVRAAEAAERATAIDVDASLEVAPGVFLPPGEGAFVVEGRYVFPLNQVEAKTKLNKGRLVAQVLVPVPVVPTRRTVQVPGTRAETRVTTAQPEFYLRTTDPGEPNIQLIRARVKSGARQIEFIDNYLGLQSSEKRDEIPVQRWQAAKGVYRFTLSRSLDPGEYVLAEIVPKEGMNLFVWDFGVDLSTTKTAAAEKQSK